MDGSFSVSWNPIKWDWFFDNTLYSVVKYVQFLKKTLTLFAKWKRYVIIILTYVT